MSDTREPLNAANRVTLARIVLIPLFLVILLTDWPRLFPGVPELAELRPIIAAGVFVVLAVTDSVDGYLARSRGEITTFGKFLDPLADKLLVTAALLALVELQLLPAWIAFVIVAREFIVSGLRMVASAEGLVIAASWYGKIKTWLQIVAIVMFLIMDSALVASFGPEFVDIFEAASWLVMGAAVIVTILSAVDYFRHASTVLVGPWRSEDS